MLDLSHLLLIPLPSVSILFGMGILFLLVCFFFNWVILWLVTVMLLLWNVACP